MFCLHLCIFTMCIPGACRSQKRTSGTLEMELTGGGEPPCMWMLGTEPRSSARADSALN